MEKQNPFDVDKVAETPHVLTYAHHVGSAVIKPVDKGKVKGRAMAAMQQQTGKQLEQIHKQIALLAEQAKELNTRMQLAEKIYSADIGFEPFVGHHYYLYQKVDRLFTLSMISPEEWGRSLKHEFVAEVKLLADHTWEIIRKNEQIDW